MGAKAHVNVTIDENILMWIDSIRGQLPRSTFINKLLITISLEGKNVFDWDMEEQLANEDIKKDRVKSFARAKDAIKWLKG